MKQNKKGLSPLRQDHLVAAGGNPLLIEPASLQSDAALHEALLTRINKIQSKTEKTNTRDVCGLLDQLEQIDRSCVPGAIYKIGEAKRGRYANPATQALACVYRKAKNGAFENIDEDLTMLLLNSLIPKATRAGASPSRAKTFEAL